MAMTKEMRALHNHFTGTPRIHELVYMVLELQAQAEILRDEVDTVWNRSLLEKNYFVEAEKVSRATRKGERVINHNQTYLLSKKDFDELMLITDSRLRAAGIKPDSMSLDYCPALVAEDELRKARRELVDLAGQPINVSADRILSSGVNWEANYKKFLDLVIGAILALDKENEV